MKVHARNSLKKLLLYEGASSKSFAGGPRPLVAQKLQEQRPRSGQQGILVGITIISHLGVLKSQRCVKTWSRSRPHKGRMMHKYFDVV